MKRSKVGLSYQCLRAIPSYFCFCCCCCLDLSQLERQSTSPINPVPQHWGYKHVATPECFSFSFSGNTSNLGPLSCTVSVLAHLVCWNRISHWDLWLDKSNPKICLSLPLILKAWETKKGGGAALQVRGPELDIRTSGKKRIWVLCGLYLRCGCKRGQLQKLQKLPQTSQQASLANLANSRPVRHSGSKEFNLNF